jgi:hypothetical protein
MNRLSNFFTGATIGAGIAYFFDPVAGNRRRAMVRDQFVHALNQTADAADVTWRDLQNRASGLMAEMRACLSADEADDEVLVHRVRSKIGRYTSHPSAVEVSARDGVVRLNGPILAHEVDNLIAAVNSVRGVQDVEDHLDAHESAENFPALQGGRTRLGEPSAFMQENWSPTARLLAGMVGTKLMFNCLTRRSPLAVLLGPAGFAMALRSFTNTDSGRLFGIAEGHRDSNARQHSDMRQQSHHAPKQHGNGSHRQQESGASV